MTKESIQKKLARLESLHDQMESELRYIDELLRAVGFPYGISSVKEVANELIESEGVLVKKPKSSRKKRSKEE